MNSMTGFGRAFTEHDGLRITVEIKTVNHRFLEISTKLPGELQGLDPWIRQYLADRLMRGKVDLSVTVLHTGERTCTDTVDFGKASFYVEAAKSLAEQFSLQNNLTAEKLLLMPDVILRVPEETDLAAAKATVAPVLSDAVDMLCAARQAEGGRIRTDLSGKLDTLSRCADEISALAPSLVEKFRSSLEEKVHLLLSDASVDEGRIAEEVTIYADRMCIDEEIVRLRSHISQLRKDLDADIPVGRNMDFLIQELNREANTILSKSTDTETADIGITMKTVIEKLREQIQNIE